MRMMRTACMCVHARIRMSWNINLVYIYQQSN
nr:MAG TPA: hypothetical protein [Caudoviricetes sp.]